jgi:hypothetical protein
MMVWKKHATKVATETGGGILLLQKVFWMRGSRVSWRKCGYEAKV